MIKFLKCSSYKLLRKYDHATLRKQVLKIFKLFLKKFSFPLLTLDNWSAGGGNPQIIRFKTVSIFITQFGASRRENYLSLLFHSLLAKKNLVESSADCSKIKLNFTKQEKKLKHVRRVKKINKQISLSARFPLPSPLSLNFNKKILFT